MQIWILRKTCGWVQYYDPLRRFEDLTYSTNELSHEIYSNSFYNKQTSIFVRYRIQASARGGICWTFGDRCHAR